MNDSVVAPYKAIRKYSFRRIFSEMEKWESLRSEGLLMEAWGVSESRAEKIFLATVESPTSMTADQLMAASRVLDCTPEEIMEEFHEPEDFRL